MTSSRTTIDDAGRVAIPGEIRDRLNLEGGEELEVYLFDGTIEIRRREESDLLEQTEGGLLTFSRSLGLTTAERVREAIEAARRERS
jgi:AbrB family looped-hinge helix DNA binding protein